MFKEIKAKGLHFIVGNTASGQPIFYLRPAGFDLEGLAALNGVGHAATLPEKGGESELQRHFIFIIEYIFTIMKVCLGAASSPHRPAAPLLHRPTTPRPHHPTIPSTHHPVP